MPDHALLERDSAPSADAPGEGTAPSANTPGEGTAPWLALGALGAIALAACADGSADGAADGAATGGQPSGVRTKAAEVGTAPVFRFAKISNGAYFYTGNAGEKDLVLRDYPDFRYEGVAFYQSPAQTGVPVFRFANLTNGGVTERDFVIQSRPDLRFEGSTFSVAQPDAQGVSPVYRLANLGNGAYLFTSSAPERDAAVATGLWRSEGIAFYTASAPPPSNSVDTDEQAARFLLQAQFSASDTEIAAVRAKGYAGWLDEQFNAATGIRAWDWLQSRGYSVLDTHNYYNQEYPTDYFAWHQLLASPDGVRKRLALALSEFFVVSVDGVGTAWRSQVMATYWDILVANAAGSFRKLLEDITLCVAMGEYLNTRGNQRENSSGRLPDENYAREVMQLFTIGLYQLNSDGTEKRDAAGNRIETYTQSDVSNLARVFTGYDIDFSTDTQQVNAFDDGRTVFTTNFTRLPMRFIPNRHSNLEVRFLGTSIAASTPGATALKTALDALFNHPNVGPFFGRQMIQRLVTSNPSPAYVGRVAAVFNDNGAGVRGDLKAVFRAILLDEEARSSKGLTEPGFGKVREPMIRLVQWARSFGLTSASGSWKLGDTSNPSTRLAQSPLRSPSVFNFFRPGYVPPSTALAVAGAPAPEFQIVSETTVSGYLNWIQDISRRGIAVKNPTVPYQVGGGPDVFDMQATYANELPIAHDAAALVRRLSLLLCAGQLSSASQTLIVDALEASPITSTSSSTVKLDRVASAVLLVMASAEYLVQK